MDFRPDLQADLYREAAAERIERQRLAAQARQAHCAAGNRAPRARVARALLGAAFAVDSGEVWRGLWDRLAKKTEPVEGDGAGR